MAVLLKHGHTEAVEGIDIARILISCQIVDPLAHLICRFICKCNAEDMPRKDPQLLHQIGKPV